MGTMLASARNFLLGLTLIMVAAVGCGEHSEPEPSKQQPELRKKIAISKKPTAQTVKPAAEVPVKPQKTELPAKPDQEAQPATEAKAEPPLPEKKGLVEPTKSESQRFAEGIRKASAYSYDPRGKLDPFKSLFQTETDRLVGTKTVKKKRLPLTPLQRVDLGQLKLVGVILSPTGNKALVEEPSGKGYIISRGTYVGTNFGRVTRVLKDKVIVEEEAEDFLSGKMKLHKRELRFPKRVGDV
jgi:type IV pilus assembly protein PilP